MNFAVAAGRHSSRAAPFLRDTPAATYYTTTRQRLHLSTAKRCADKAGHLKHHEHEHTHEEMVHEHGHVHDEHHRHAHGPDDPAGEPHAHVHRHAHMAHRHPHYPDLHHRHTHMA